MIAHLNLRKQEILEKLLGLGQIQWEKQDAAALDGLLEQLLPAEQFYKEMGGLLGYQKKIASLLDAKENLSKESVSYHPPTTIDISEESPAVWSAIFAAIEALPQMVEMVPLGGAADRLHLLDEETGSELPAAKLPFAGRPLLATLMRDLQASEYLYYKIHGHQVTVPVAFMTSREKDNHRHVHQLMQEADGWGRPSDSVRFFQQPLVPVVRKEGDWCWLAPYKPLLKPGGHGAIWKLARDLGIFQWFAALGKKKGLIRQINNPLAGLDYGLLAFCGVGIQRDQLFGFASCPRSLSSAEGINVIIQRKETLCLTNIEYCDFVKVGIENHLDAFPANTNILFADLPALEQAVGRCPYPGLLINLKKITYKTHTGEVRKETLARLESTMQNIADVFEEPATSLIPRHTFITSNHRHKTISTAKKAYLGGSEFQETPEKCFYDLLQAHRELLLRSRWQLPPPSTLEHMLATGPEFLFLYHPALGPLYSIITQKLRGGGLASGSELQLEIADLDLQNLSLSGSLRIHAAHIMGPPGHYSDQTGRCTLKNVTICNRGIDWTQSRPFWKNRPHRLESLEIILEGHSSFTAEGMTLNGSHRFTVPDGVAMRLIPTTTSWKIETAPIKPGPFWVYEKATTLHLKKAAR